MISMKELNPHDYDTDAETQGNLEELLDRLNQVRSLYGKPMKVTSGLRSQADQARINPSAPKSKHLMGCAADIYDPDGALWKWIEKNMDSMEEIGFWFEAKSATPTWVHFQTRAPKSGKRVFNP